MSLYDATIWLCCTFGREEVRPRIFSRWCEKLNTFTVILFSNIFCERSTYDNTNRSLGEEKQNFRDFLLGFCFKRDLPPPLPFWLSIFQQKKAALSPLNPPPPPRLLTMKAHNVLQPMPGSEWNGYSQPRSQGQLRFQDGGVDPGNEVGILQNQKSAAREEHPNPFYGAFHLIKISEIFYWKSTGTGKVPGKIPKI